MIGLRSCSAQEQEHLVRSICASVVTCLQPPVILRPDLKGTHYVSFRDGEAVEESAVACSGYRVSSQQIPPFGPKPVKPLIHPKNG